MAVAHLPSDSVVQDVELKPSTIYIDLENNCDVHQADSLLRSTQGMSKSPIPHEQHDIDHVYEYEKDRQVACGYDTQGYLVGHLIVLRQLCQVLQQPFEIPQLDKKIQVVLSRGCRGCRSCRGCRGCRGGRCEQMIEIVA